ncbi:MAG TPA: hypothetical protein VHM91_18385, partial [Verrucomicrobiales bacterium]|nr:hypothetical protein [Verrucomicrobiales bacterium]
MNSPGDKSPHPKAVTSLPSAVSTSFRLRSPQRYARKSARAGSPGAKPPGLRELVTAFRGWPDLSG